MLTLYLPPELEQAVQKQAQQQGTTPELLASEVPRQRFLPVSAVPVTDTREGQSMADFLGDFIGCYDSREIVPGGANLAEDTGHKFTELLMQKRKKANSDAP